MKNILSKHKRLIVYLSFFILTGCSSTNSILNSKYRPEKNIDPILHSSQKITLSLDPVTGMDDYQWYKLGSFSWTLAKKPTVLVRDMLEREFPFWGLELSDDLKRAKGILEVSVRWFGPYGNSPVSAAVILGVTLFANNKAEPVWHGKIEGGVLPQPLPVGADNVRISIEEAIEEALSEAVYNLRWNGEFCQAIRLLSEH